MTGVSGTNPTLSCAKGAVHGERSSTPNTRTTKPRSDAVLARGESISMARRAAATAKKRREEARAELERRGIREGMDSALEGIVGHSASTRANVSQNKVKRSKRVKWNNKEVEALREGVNKYGEGRWAVILREYASCFNQCRISVDLKDKWRNLYKAHRGVSLQQGYSKLSQENAANSVRMVDLHVRPAPQPQYMKAALTTGQTGAKVATHEATDMKEEKAMVNQVPLENSVNVSRKHDMGKVEIGSQRMPLHVGTGIQPTHSAPQLPAQSSGQVVRRQRQHENYAHLPKEVLRNPNRIVTPIGCVHHTEHVTHAARVEDAVSGHYREVKRHAHEQRDQRECSTSFVEHVVTQNASMLENMQHVSHSHHAERGPIEHQEHGELHGEVQHPHFNHSEHQLVGHAHRVIRGHLHRAELDHSHQVYLHRVNAQHVQNPLVPGRTCEDQTMTATREQKLEHLYVAEAEKKQQLLHDEEKPKYMQFDVAADHPPQSVQKVEFETVAVVEENDDDPSTYHSHPKLLVNNQYVGQGQGDHVSHKEEHHPCHKQPMHEHYTDHAEVISNEQEAAYVEQVVDGGQVVQNEALVTEQATEDAAPTEGGQHVVKHAQQVENSHEHYVVEQQHPQDEQLIEHEHGHYDDQQQSVQHEQHIHHEEVLPHGHHEVQGQHIDVIYCRDQEQQIEHKHDAEHGAEHDSQLVENGESLDQTVIHQGHEVSEHEHGGQHHTAHPESSEQEIITEAQHSQVQDEMAQGGEREHEGGVSSYAIISQHAKAETHELEMVGTDAHAVPADTVVDGEEAAQVSEEYQQRGEYAVNVEDSGQYHTPRNVSEPEESVEEQNQIQMKGTELVEVTCHEDERVHDHSHDYEHEYGHEHEYEHEHEHEYEHEHEHEHEQDHEQGQEHEHEEEQDQDQDQEHEHEQEQVQEQEQEQEQEHGHGHGHGHEDEHGHGQEELEESSHVEEMEHEEKVAAMHEHETQEQGISEQVAQVVVVEKDSRVFCEQGLSEGEFEGEDNELHESGTAFCGAGNVTSEERGEGAVDEEMGHVEMEEGLCMVEAVYEDRSESRGVKDRAKVGSDSNERHTIDENSTMEEEVHTENEGNSGIERGDECGEKAEHIEGEEFRTENEHEVGEGDVTGEKEYEEHDGRMEGEMQEMQVCEAAHDGEDVEMGRYECEDVNKSEGAGEESAKLADSVGDEFKDIRMLGQSQMGINGRENGAQGSEESGIKLEAGLEYSRRCSSKNLKQEQAENVETKAEEIERTEPVNETSERQGKRRGLKRERGAMEDEEEQEQIEYESGRWHQKGRIDEEKGEMEGLGDWDASGEAMEEAERKGDAKEWNVG